MFKVINGFRELVEGSIKNHSALMHLFSTTEETPTRNLQDWDCYVHGHQRKQFCLTSQSQNHSYIP